MKNHEAIDARTTYILDQLRDDPRLAHGPYTVEELVDPRKSPGPHFWLPYYLMNSPNRADELLMAYRIVDQVGHATGQIGGTTVKVGSSLWFMLKVMEARGKFAVIAPQNRGQA